MDQDSSPSGGNEGSAGPTGSGVTHRRAAVLPTRQQVDAQRQYLEGAIRNFTEWGCLDQVAIVKARLKSIEGQLQQPALKGAIALRQALQATRAHRERALASLDKQLEAANNAVVAAQTKVT